MINESTWGGKPVDIIKLPWLNYDTKTSVESTLFDRRSFRRYRGESLTLVKDVEDLPERIYQYKPHKHELLKIADGDK